MASGSFYPAVQADDGYWSTGIFEPTNLVITIGNPYSVNNSWIRFPNVTIPKGSTIITCILKLASKESAAGTTVNVNVYFNNVDNAVAPTDESEADALVKTSAVAWNNVPAFVDTTVYDSPELKTILQTIVDREEFASGNAVQVLVNDNASTEGAYRWCQDVSLVTPPQLYIEWTPPVGITSLMTLPLFQLSGTIVNPYRFMGVAISLPLLHVDGEFTNPSRHISSSLSLPVLQLYGAATVPGHNEVTGSISLPLLKSYAIISPMVYVSATLDKSLGAIEIVAESGGYIDTEIGAVSLAGFATYHPVAGLSKSIGAIQLTASALQEEIGRLDIQIPGIIISARGAISEIGKLSVAIPAIRLTANAIAGYIGSLDKSIGPISLAALSHWSGANNASLIIPAIVLEARGRSVAEEIIALTLNTMNFGLTKYTNYDYNSLCIFNGIPIGAKSGGIYELSGITDDGGEVISWKLKTGKLLLHKSKLREIWLFGKISGDILMSVETAEGKKYEYDVEPVSENEDSRRIKIGKGLVSKYITVELTNQSDETIQIDKIQGFGMKP